MARVRDVGVDEVPAALKSIYAAFGDGYGNFANQASVLAHSPGGLRHLYGLLLEWRESGSISRRHVEIAVVTVSRINRCSYCVAHHGVQPVQRSPAGRPRTGCVADAHRRCR